MDVVEPAPGPTWDRLTAEDIAPGVEAANRAADALVDEAVALPAEAGFDAVFGRFDRAGRVIAERIVAVRRRGRGTQPTGTRAREAAGLRIFMSGTPMP